MMSQSAVLAHKSATTACWRPSLFFIAEVVLKQAWLQMKKREGRTSCINLYS